VSKVKNVSGGALDVPLLDRIVEDGEIVDVPDVQADGESPIIWPSNRWEPVTDKAAKAAAKADSAAAADATTPADDTTGEAAT
jgi:hypothetical protein